MELSLWSAVILSACVHVTFTKRTYESHELESFNLCRYGKEEGSIYITPWEAIILKVGHQLKKDGSQASRSIHECKVSIRTSEGFGIVAVIEEMKLQGKRNKHNGWDCEGDYVKLSTGSDSTIWKVRDMIFGDLFKKKSTDELCGIRQRESQRFSEVGTSANVLSTMSNALEVDFHQRESRRHFVNNSFSIVFTTFKHKSEEVFTEACAGRYLCPGKNNNNYCISQDYVCDGHYNCAFLSAAADEMDCPEPGASQYPMFTATTTIIMTLACIVGLGLVICCLFTIVMRAKSRNTTRAGTPVTAGAFSDASAPPVDRQQTLPAYEAVVMSDLEGDQKVSVPSTPAVGEYPPSYDDLFPSGPPKIQSNEVST